MNFVFFEYSRGYLKGYFGESHVLYVGGYFCTSLAFLFCSWSRGCQDLSLEEVLWGVEKAHEEKHTHTHKVVSGKTLGRPEIGLPDRYRVRKSSSNFFFSNFSGAPGISRQKSRDVPPKVWFPSVSKDIPNFLDPTPSRGRPPPHPKVSGPKSLGLGSFLLPENSQKTARHEPKHSLMN